MKQSETVWAHATQWISRTLAVALVMVLPGMLGSMLDKKLGTSFLAPLGFFLGLVAGTVGLLVLAKQFTPPAHGDPLPWDETSSDKEANELEASSGSQHQSDQQS